MGFRPVLNEHGQPVRVRRHATAALWLVIPVLIVASIWLPVVRHYRVSDAAISRLIVEQARQEPSDALLQRLRGDRLLYHGWTSDQQVVAAAEALLRGELHVSGHAPIKYRLPFHPEDLVSGLPSLQLQVAGLVAVDLLLHAYELTRQERFFEAARDSVVEFARYERGAWMPSGLLWNDHAVANRVFVLSDFWRVFRRHRDFQPEAAGTILGLVARSGELLAKREHFTFASNHGVMQSTALLRYRLSFPALPFAEDYQRLARERLNELMAYYVNEEGVVLEHSASYQFFGIQLLGLAFRYIHLLDLPVPTEWERKHAKAVQFAAQLRRPDGSLPTFGDTPWRSRRPDPLEEERDPPRSVASARRPDPPIAWYPVAGYAVWWDGLEHWPDSPRLRQTLVAFSFFPGHAHKHADDLSVVLWAGGQTWWTNLGYWSYGLPERSQAESWNGSNAPHLVDEPKDSRRTPKMLFHGSSSRVVMLDVERDGPGTYAARRQVLHLKPNAWLVLDSISGSPGLRSMTRWTIGYGIRLREHETARRYVLEAEDAPATLVASFFGSPGLSLRRLANTLGPFAGRSAPAASESGVPAIEVEQPADGSWAGVVWVFDQDGTLVPPGGKPEMVLWHSPEHWTAIVPGESTAMEIARRGDRLSVREVEGKFVETLLLGTASYAPQRAEIRRAFLNAEAKYPRFRNHLRYRQWSTYLLVAAAAVQELLFLGFSSNTGRVYGWLRLLTLGLWIGGGIWLVAVFS